MANEFIGRNELAAQEEIKLSDIDVLLINPAPPRVDRVAEHLGIASLKAFLLSRGIETETLDMSIEQVSVSETVDQILAAQPRIVGVSMLDDTKDSGFSVIRQLSTRGFGGKIVLGGYFPTFASKDILRDFPDVDFVVRGEGEITLFELVEFELGKDGAKPIEQIEGLSYRHDGQIVENPSRPLIADLDILPPVDRKYAPQVLSAGQYLSVFATRGCWGSCSFCDIVGLYGISKGKRWRRRSVERLVDELEDLAHRFNTRHFIFNDDQFLVKGNSAYRLVDEFASELERRNLKIEFELMCRADTVNRKVMQRLKDIGLKRVFLGLESFDEKQLQRMNKRISVRQNLKAVITLYKLKIDVIASVILADAYTKLWDLLLQFTILYILRKRYFNSEHSKISVNKKLEVYRGSPVYQEYKRKGILTKDHYLTGCDYKLKFWTNLRLKMLSLEEGAARFLFRPKMNSTRVGDEFQLNMTPLKQKQA
ncbi:MAG TPA: radical SAM protein [Caldithrix abyssi]|uniref:Radical SAM protein n=1 Tax=Caldithrix abyssi TaxID=187145 RepID=A0A7V4WVP8_CALAY|nr:radical SAM protein [Caldithrix abyssi]